MDKSGVVFRKDLRSMLRESGCNSTRYCFLYVYLNGCAGQVDNWLYLDELKHCHLPGGVVKVGMSIVSMQLICHYGGLCLLLSRFCLFDKFGFLPSNMYCGNSRMLAVFLKQLFTAALVGRNATTNTLLYLVGGLKQYLLDWKTAGCVCFFALLHSSIA